MKFLILFCSVLITQFTFCQIHLDDGLVAYYPFNGNANDISGNGNNAIFNNATLTADKNGNLNSAYLFNGLDNYIRVPNSTSLNSGSQISFALYVQPKGFYQGPCHGNIILSKADQGFGNYSFIFSDVFYTNGNNCANPDVDEEHQNFYANGIVAPNGYSPFISLEKWYCLVYTYDGAYAKIYIDGKLIVSSYYPDIFFGNSDDLFIGKLDNAQFPYWFNGVMDELRIYNRALNESEVSALCSMNQGSVPLITCPENIIAVSDQNACSKSISFYSTATGIPEPTISYSIGGSKITSPYSFPVGITTVTATAENSNGKTSCTFTVTVKDEQKPVISDIMVSPSELWPPNHKMRDIVINYTTKDNCSLTTVCSLSVSSNESINGSGDGNTSYDWIVIDEHHVKLRAERSGNGKDRIYTIKINCIDQSGNIATRTTTVNVAHDNSNEKGNEITNLKTKGFMFNVFNNPTSNYFSVSVDAKKTQDILLRIIDLTGNVLETKSNVTPGHLLKVGNNLKPGVYIIEVTQGNFKDQIKVLKN